MHFRSPSGDTPSFRSLMGVQLSYQRLVNVCEAIVYPDLQWAALAELRDNIKIWLTWSLLSVTKRVVPSAGRFSAENRSRLSIAHRFASKFSPKLPNVTVRLSINAGTVARGLGFSRVRPKFAAVVALDCKCLKKLPFSGCSKPGIDSFPSTTAFSGSQLITFSRGLWGVKL